MVHAIEWRGDRRGRSATVRLSGPLVGGLRARRLLESARGALSAGSRALTIDLSGVPFVDCGGIGILLRCHAEARKRGAAFRLTHASRPVRSMLALSRLLRPLAGSHDDPRGRKPRPGQDVPLLLSA